MAVAPAYPGDYLVVRPARIGRVRCGWRAWTASTTTGELTPRRWAATRVGAIVRALYDHDPAVRRAARNYAVIDQTPEPPDA